MELNYKSKWKDTQNKQIFGNWAALPNTTVQRIIWGENIELFWSEQKFKDNENTIYKNILDVADTMCREEFLALSAYNTKEGKNQW